MSSVPLQLLTNSRMRTERECQRKHDFMYRQGIRPITAGEALYFGSLMHLCLEAWWKAFMEGRNADALPDAIAMAVREEDAYKREQMLAVIIGYHQYYAGAMTEYKVLAVEKQFTAPLINPSTQAASRTWQLAGKIDVIVERGGRVAIIEHKSSSESIDSDADLYWQRLQMDHQSSMYVVGAETLEYGEVKDVIYDVVKKPQQRPLKATPEDSRKYKANGELYANQRDVDETAEEYGARIAADIESRPGHYYVRRLVPRLEGQILDFLYDAWQTGRDIRDAELAGRSIRNPEACNRYSVCPFFQACVNGLDPMTLPGFTKSDNVHPELKEEPPNA